MGEIIYNLGVEKHNQAKHKNKMHKNKQKKHKVGRAWTHNEVLQSQQ